MRGRNSRRVGQRRDPYEIANRRRFSRGSRPSVVRHHRRASALSISATRRRLSALMRVRRAGEVRDRCYGYTSISTRSRRRSASSPIAAIGRRSRCEFYVRGRRGRISSRIHDAMDRFVSNAIGRNIPSPSEPSDRPLIRLFDDSGISASSCSRSCLARFLCWSKDVPRARVVVSGAVKSSRAGCQCQPSKEHRGACEVGHSSPRPYSRALELKRNQANATRNASRHLPPCCQTHTPRYRAAPAVAANDASAQERSRKLREDPNPVQCADRAVLYAPAAPACSDSCAPANLDIKNKCPNETGVKGAKKKKKS